MSSGNFTPNYQRNPLAAAPQTCHANRALAPRVMPGRRAGATGAGELPGPPQAQIAARAFRSFTPSGTPQPVTASNPAPAL
jgi:hypothetical protein